MSNLEKRSEEKADDLDEYDFNKDHSKGKIPDQQTNSETDEKPKAPVAGRSSDHQTPGNTSL